MLRNEGLKYLFTFGRYYLDEALLRHDYVQDIISDNHCKLKSIVVCDFENRGKMFIGEEEIAAYV